MNDMHNAAAASTAEDALARAIADGIEIIDLGQPLFVGMGQSSMHPKFQLTLQRRHGDLVRPDGASGANELIVTGGHVGTHIDAFSHISNHGHLHGGVDAAAAQTGGRFKEHGAEKIEPIIGRGILLDVAGVLGVERLKPAYEISVDDLKAALARTGATPQAGDVLLIRTGWGALYADAVAYENLREGAPGPGVPAGQWLADFKPRACGSDTIAFERIPPIETVPSLPVHSLMLVEHGIHLIEIMMLEELAKAAVYEFTFVMSPLKIVGATGAPARPLALRSKAR